MVSKKDYLEFDIIELETLRASMNSQIKEIQRKRIKVDKRIKKKKKELIKYE